MSDVGRISVTHKELTRLLESSNRENPVRTFWGSTAPIPEIMADPWAVELLQEWRAGDPVSGAT